MDRNEQMSAAGLGGTPVTAPAPNADAADTNIYVSPAPRPAPAPAPAPEFKPSYTITTQAPEPAPISTQTVVHEPVTQTVTRHTPATTHTSTHKDINWGGVVKGALIVTGVVLVGVAAFYGVSALAGWAMSTSAGSAVAGTMEPIVSSVGGALSTAGHWAAGFVGHIPGAIGGFIGGLFGAGEVAVTAAGAATTANVAGVVAAGGVGAAALAHTAPDLENIHLTQQHTTTVTTPGHTEVQTVAAHATHTHSNIATDAAAAPDMLDSDFSPELATANANAVTAAQQNLHANHALEHASHQAWELGHHSMHLANHKAHVAAHTMDTDVIGSQQEMGDQVSAEDVAAPEPDVDGLDWKRGTVRGWRSKLSGNSSKAQYASHAEQVMANRAASQPITSRGSNFSEALDADRERLANAMGEPQIG